VYLEASGLVEFRHYVWWLGPMTLITLVGEGAAVSAAVTTTLDCDGPTHSLLGHARPAISGAARDGFVGSGPMY